MSIATQLTRIQTDRNTIRNKLVSLGLANSTDNLDKLAAAVDGIIDQGAVSAEILEGTSYTIPAGYHNGSGIVKAMTDVVGEAEKYKTQAKTATPTKHQQSITPDDGYYALESVTVNSIPDAYQDVSSVTAGAADVLSGKVIVTPNGTVTAGTMVNNGSIKKILNTSTPGYKIPLGYHDGTGVVTTDHTTGTATPTKETQTIKGGGGSFLSQVTVNPIPDAYQDVTGVTATAETVWEGSTFVDAEGKKVDGRMDNHGLLQITMTNEIPYAKSLSGGYYDGIIVYTKTGSVIATPTKEEQVIEPTDGTFYVKATINPIPDEYQDVTSVTATADTVLEGSTCVDDEGNVLGGRMDNHGDVEVILKNETPYSEMLPSGYYDSILIYPKTRFLTATPTKEEQIIEPTDGEFFRKATINPIPDAYQDVTAVDAEAVHVLSGKKIVDATGAVVTGAMANNGDVSASFDGLTTTSVTIPAGYTSGGTISLTADIEESLASI